jgi:hypothetical protein
MSQNLEIVNIGTLPNDGEGDPLRVAFAKINNNFAKLANTSFATSSQYSVGDTPNQVIFETPKSAFTQGLFQIRSWDPGTPNSQDIMLQAQITNSLDDVKFTAYGTSFNGNAVCRYDMDVFNNNVRILVNPLANVILNHFISSQVTFIGEYEEGIPLGLDGYVDGFVMSTEDNLTVTTENDM